MAIKFQYNKTSLQSLNKQLGIRVRALPTIKNKESALRLEVKKAKAATINKRKDLKEIYDSFKPMVALWEEFDMDLLQVEKVDFKVKKIAGVKVPNIGEITFFEKPFLAYNAPLWFYEGIKLLKRFIELELEVMILNRQLELLEYARKKTTQKVNLYEKVQIPEYENGIRKIKRFLEDEENLSKSAMKIVKSRQEKQEAAR